MKQLHTYTEMFSIELKRYPETNLILSAANRKRTVRIYRPGIGGYGFVQSVVLISTNRQILIPNAFTSVYGAYNPGNAILLTTAEGVKFNLGPNQELWGTYFTPDKDELVIISVIVEDNILEGIFSDISSDVEESQSSGESVAETPSDAPAACENNIARRK